MILSEWAALDETWRLCIQCNRIKIKGNLHVSSTVPDFFFFWRWTRRGVKYWVELRERGKERVVISSDKIKKIPLASLRGNLHYWWRHNGLTTINSDKYSNYHIIYIPSSISCLDSHCIQAFSYKTHLAALFSKGKNSYKIIANKPLIITQTLSNYPTHTPFTLY